MPDQPAIRVMFRWHAGLPWRQASKERQQALAEAISKLLEGWKASGIKLLATFGSSAHVDGFAHYAIFEVNSLADVSAMDRDIISGEIGKSIEDFQIHIGVRRPFMEDIWA